MSNPPIIICQSESKGIVNVVPEIRFYNDIDCRCLRRTVTRCQHNCGNGDCGKYSFHKNDFKVSRSGHEAGTGVQYSNYFLMQRTTVAYSL